MFQENIQVLRRAFCAGCLSQERKLSSIKDLKKYAFFCYALSLDEKDWVCWECRQMVLKLAAFRKRVADAQSALADLLGGRPCQINSYSTLTTVKVTVSPDNEEEFGNVLVLGDPLYYQLVKEKVSGDDESVGDDDNEAWGDDVAKDEEDDDAMDDGVVEELTKEDNKIKNKASNEITHSGRTYQKFPNVAVKKLRDDNQITNRKRDSAFSNTSTVHISFDEAEIPLPKPKPKIQINTRSVIKVPNTRSKGSGADSFVEVDNPFTVEIMSQDEMAMWRVRKTNMEFFSNCTPLKRCEECMEPFDSQRMYTAHMKGHTKDYGEKICDICDMNFHDEEELKIHKERHYKLLQCKQCEFQWDSSNGMRRHCELSHGVPVAAWLCDHCNREFAELSKLMRHRTCHLSRKCPECGIILRSFVKKHMMRAHKHLPVLECGACGLQCKGNSGLQEHVKNCRNVEDQTFCVECNVEFKSKYSYRAHFKNTIRHATDEQLRFQCTQCGRGFLDAASLLNHTDSVHERQKKYLCDLCGKGFFTMISRKKHQRRWHSGRAVRKDKICDYCGKGFERKRTLLQHMNKHTGARPYACACGAAFAYECVLRNHVRRKHAAPTDELPQGSPGAAVEVVPQCSPDYVEVVVT